jgi:hypothetical protein
VQQRDGEKHVALLKTLRAVRKIQQRVKKWMQKIQVLDMKTK